MYVPAGFGPGELGDVEVVAHAGRLHAFALTLPNHDRVAHLVSDDGLRWERLPDALHTGRPGTFDDDMIWTVSVTEVGPSHHMLYTALSTRDGGRVQRIGLAESTDLEHWTKHEGPVSAPTPDHYEDRAGRAPWASWRDPKPTRVSDGFVTTVCARERDAPPRRAGAIARLDSHDLQQFRVQTPLFAPRRHFELECPQVFTIEGRWFLTASVMDDRSQRYWVADALDGPWRTPPANRLLPAGHYAARVFRWNDRHALLGWYRDASGHGALLSPVLLAVQESGHLMCEPWPAWNDQAAGAPRRWTDLEPLFGNPHARREGPLLSSASGMELWATKEPWRAARVHVEVRGGAASWGLAFGLDDEGNGWFVELDAGERRCRLVLQGPGRDHEGHPWFTHEVLQEAPWAPATDRTRLTLRLVDGEVELAVGDRVVLLARVGPGSGRLGLFLDSGTLELLEAELTPMRVPGGDGDPLP